MKPDEMAELRRLARRWRAMVGARRRKYPRFGKFIELKDDDMAELANADELSALLDRLEGKEKKS